MKAIELDTRNNQQFAKQLAEDIIADVKTCLKRAIDRTIIEMPIDCSDEREEYVSFDLLLFTYQ